MKTLCFQITALLLVACPLTLPSPARAAQSYDACTGFITSLPTTINTQGVWCFNANLETAITSGNAITIATNNVTIDCNDFKLGGLQAGIGTSAIGISATSRLNATVRHCNIRGFFFGLSLDGGGHLVEDNRFDANTFIGVSVSGDGSLIQRNRVNDTGGYSGFAYGIYAVDSVDLLDNSVDGVAPSAFLGNSDAYGIYTSSNLSGSVIGNRVRGLAPLGAGGGYGIYNESSGRISLERNHLAGPGTYGLFCDSTLSNAKGNFVNGFTTWLSGCKGGEGNHVIYP